MPPALISAPAPPLIAVISGGEISHLLGRWGYGLVFIITALQSVGVPLPGTTALVAAALYAGSTHHLAITGVVLAAAVGGVCGNVAGFVIGRWGGSRALGSYGHYLRLTPERLRTFRTRFLRHSWQIVFVGRFITGLRNLTGLLAGTNRMAFNRFLLAAGTSAALWALMNGLGYFYFGHLLRTASVEVDVLLALAGVAWIAGAIVYTWKRGRRLGLAAEGGHSGSHE